jgi:hypothetical protein
MKTLRKIRKFLSQMLLLEAIRAQWHLLVTSFVALDPLHQMMHLVFYLHTAMANKMANKYGTFFIVLLFSVPCWPPG